MFPQDIIAAKRDGQRLSRKQLEAWIAGVADGSFSDYQSSALLMAILLQGMDSAETAALVDAMLHSGDVLDLSEVGGVKVDKHSTGGVGDKVSLVLAPWVAACGVPVPMMSGRGLGITGGTLDKLESIPGFRVGLDELEFRAQLRRIGSALIGQTARLAPADRRLYALRDATATVESIPLIAASIMSKKLASGIDALVLDVKCGRGAFMKDAASARALAEALVATGRAAGKPTVALLTRMDQPLGRAVGNALEVAESVACLRGEGSADLMEVTRALAREMLILGKVAADQGSADSLLNDRLESRTALEKFKEIAAAQGGDAMALEDLSRLPGAESVVDVFLEEERGGSGSEVKTFVASVDAAKIANAARMLGAGRSRMDQSVDHAVGVSDLVKVGEPLVSGQPVCRLHLNDPRNQSEAEALIREAIETAPEPPPERPLVFDRLTSA